MVDDHLAMARYVAALLTRLGAEKVDMITNPSEALVLLRHKTYDLVLSDWNMRPISGLDLLKEARAMPGMAQLPFILVTAEIEQNNVVAAKRAGVSAYLAKPFSLEQLRARIAAVLLPGAGT